MCRTLISTVLIAAAGIAQAGPTAVPVRAEIDGLLGDLLVARCEFERNGTWHSGAEARSHMLRKLDYLEGRGDIRSAEHFIDTAASASSVTGQPYRVRCDGQPAVDSRGWLLQRLAALRAAARTAKP